MNNKYKMQNKFTLILISGTKTLIYDSNIFINLKYDLFIFTKFVNIDNILYNGI